MLFNSLTFLLFFAVVMVVHNLPLPWRFKKTNLLIASYLFYAAWSPPFVVLIWLSTVVDWFVARRMYNAKTPLTRRVLLLCSLCCNLGLLGYFKYGDFLVENSIPILWAMGIEYLPPESNIILPVGISFYTFQTLSYTIDVYRGEMKPWKSFLDFALFVTFFPQLVAGPIVRASQFLPQCEIARRATGQQFSWGLVLLIVGLFQKVILADLLMAPMSDRTFGQLEPVVWYDAWIGVLAFSMQILFDFGGYSTCAIGVALCLGFALPDNFRHPYAAVGFSDFWRRWHISLSSWLRDYLYISLGGNRISKRRTQYNLMATMLIGGLWHGAAWTFVVWGGLHGFYLVVERVAERIGFMDWVRGGRWRMLLTALATFIAVSVAWVPFRSQSFSGALNVLQSLSATYTDEPVALFSPARMMIVLVVVCAVLAYQWWMRESSLEELAARMPIWSRTAFVVFMVLVLLWFSREVGDRAFIYFQF